MYPTDDPNINAKMFNSIADLNFDLNNCRPNSIEFNECLKKIVNYIGPDTIIKGPVYFDIGNVTIGKHCFINRDVKFIDFGGITLGDNVGISTNVVLIANGHPANPLTLETWVDTKEPITIDDGAWIGAGAIIKGPVHLGKNCIVGAGAVVVHDIPDYAVVVGVPAEIIKYTNK